MSVERRIKHIVYGHGHWPEIFVIVLKIRHVRKRKKNRNNVRVIKFSDYYNVNGAICVCVFCIVHIAYEPLKWDDLILVSATKKIPSPQKRKNSDLCMCVCVLHGKYELKLCSQKAIFTLQYMYASIRITRHVYD